MPKPLEAVPDFLRRLVAERAGYRCEYCLIMQRDTFLGCEIDHIISRKHGGSTEADNLAYACFYCNRHKGSDIASLTNDGQLMRLFNPRLDAWHDHLKMNQLIIEWKTPIGEVTVRLLQFNATDRLLERNNL